MGFTGSSEDPNCQNMKWYVIAICRSLRDQGWGYYIAEVIIYGNPLVPVSSIPGNLVQIGVAAVIVHSDHTIKPAARKTGLKTAVIVAQGNNKDQEVSYV